MQIILGDKQEGKFNEKTNKAFKANPVPVLCPAYNSSTYSNYNDAVCLLLTVITTVNYKNYSLCIVKTIAARNSCCTQLLNLTKILVCIYITYRCW